MSQTDRKTRRRKEERPAEIMTAGLAAFAEKGFAATRLEDVAESAGVSKATIYLYFDSKADLLKAILRETISPQISEIEAVFEGFDGPSSELLRMLYARATMVVSMPVVRSILKLIISESGNFPDIVEFYRTEVAFRGLHTIARLIERGIERGEFRPCDPVATAQSVIFPVLMNTIAIEVFGTQPELDQSKLFPSHIEFALRGLAADREVA